MRCTAPTSHLHPPSHGPQQHTGRSHASRATGLTSCRTAVNLRWQIISDHAPQRAVRAQQPHLGAAQAALAREEALGWTISSKRSMLVLLLQPPAANARKKRSVPRLARSRQRVRSHGSSGPQSARSCSKCVRELFANGSHRGSSSSCARASSPGLAAAPWSWLCRRRRAAQGRNWRTS